MAIRHRDVFPVGSSPDSIQWDVWNADHEGVAGSITQDQQDALDAANAPTTGNPFATLADVGGGGGGLAIYGDASDGDVVIDGPDWPALTGIDDWEPATAYLVGDLVKSTGSNVRVFRCVVGGTSGGSDPFLDVIPGWSSRGHVQVENHVAAVISPPGSGLPIWVQTTAVIDGNCEGNIYAENLSIDVDLISKGWILYATDTFTLAAAVTLSANGASAVDENGARSSATSLTFPLSSYLNVPTLGLGQAGADTAPSPEALPTDPLVLGTGGYGGSGGDGDGGTATYDLARVGYRAVRALPSLLMRTLPKPLNTGSPPGAYDLTTPQFVSWGGAAGASDAAFVGGGGGEGGSPIVLFAKALVLAGALSSVGGDGAPGDAGGDTGGGGGGQGGAIILVYDSLDDTGATYDVSGGIGGSRQGAGTDGGDGTDGAVIRIPNA